jgi:hypothetical protein
VELEAMDRTIDPCAIFDAFAWAQVWCENANGVVSNMPEFQKAFSGRADAPMVRQNGCRLW